MVFAEQVVLAKLRLRHVVGGKWDYTQPDHQEKNKSRLRTPQQVTDRAKLRSARLKKNTKNRMRQTAQALDSSTESDSAYCSGEDSDQQMSSSSRTPSKDTSVDEDASKPELLREDDMLEFDLQASEQPIVKQLSKLLGKQALEPEELSLLYSYRYSCSVEDALKALGHKGGLRDFLEGQRCFSFQGQLVQINTPSGELASAGQKASPQVEQLTSLQQQVVRLIEEKTQLIETHAADRAEDARMRRDSQAALDLATEKHQGELHLATENFQLAMRTQEARMRRDSQAALDLAIQQHQADLHLAIENHQLAMRAQEARMRRDSQAALDLAIQQHQAAGQRLAKRKHLTKVIAAAQREYHELNRAEESEDLQRAQRPRHS